MTKSDLKSSSRRGSETRQKTFQVATRYSADEYRQMMDAASRAGLTPASFQRVQTLTTTPKTRARRRAPVENENLARLLAQLGKVGSNLNQLAHAAHLDQTRRAEIIAAVAELRALRAPILEALGRDA